MDWKLELIVVPASDVDRAKDFYVQKAGFEVLVDVSPGGEFRVVQLTPKGSACAIAIMKNPDRAGAVQGLPGLCPLPGRGSRRQAAVR